MVSRNRTSLICINLCLYSHLQTYTVLVEKLNRGKLMKLLDYSFWNDLKWLLTIFKKKQFLVLLNYSEQDKESLPAPADNCLCQAGLSSWSVTPLMNRTMTNILLLCKVLFPGSLHPLPSVHNSGSRKTSFLFFLSLVLMLQRHSCCSSKAKKTLYTALDSIPYNGTTPLHCCSQWWQIKFWNHAVCKNIKFWLHFVIVWELV